MNYLKMTSVTGLSILVLGQIFSASASTNLYRTSSSTTHATLQILESSELDAIATKSASNTNLFTRTVRRGVDYTPENLRAIMPPYSDNSLMNFARLMTTEINDRPALFTINIAHSAAMMNSTVPRPGLIANRTMNFEQIILGTNAFDPAKPFPSIPGFQWPEGTTLVAQQFNGAPDSNLIRMSEASVAHFYPRAVCYQAQYCGQIQGLQLGNSPTATSLHTLRQIGNARMGRYDLILAADFAANKVESVDYYLRIPVQHLAGNVAFATETMRLNTNIQNMMQSMRQALGRRNPISNAIRIYNQFHKREKELGYDTSDIEEIAPWILEQPSQPVDDSIINQIAERTAARRYYRQNPTTASAENDFAIVQVRLMMNQ